MSSLRKFVVIKSRTMEEMLPRSWEHAATNCNDSGIKMNVSFLLIWLLVEKVLNKNTDYILFLWIEQSQADSYYPRFYPHSISSRNK